MLKRLAKKVLRIHDTQIVGPSSPGISKATQGDDEKNFINKVSRTESKLPTLPVPYKDILFSGFALQKLINEYKFQTILDIGSGSGKHSKIFREAGKEVTSIDFGESVYFEERSENYTLIKANYYENEFTQPFDAIWASHVLEHQPNPNLFLQKVHRDLREGGILAITVPPLKHQIVGGHLSLWNAGLLLYQLIFAGFNCRDASILKYGYNISLIVEKHAISSLPKLDYDKGDIEKLLPYFPEGFSEPFNGDIRELNWFKKSSLT